MEKELNPNLFSTAQNETVKEPSTSTWYSDASMAFAPNAMRGDRALDRIELRKIEEKFEMLNDKVQEALKTVMLKTEKVGQRAAQLDQRVDGISQELRSKYATLSGKVTERNLMETEVHALLERHNQVVRNFENRLTQMQRLIEGQQLQLMNSQAALEEARREIARLKRL